MNKPKFAKGPWVITHGLPEVPKSHVAISSELHINLATVVWQMEDKYWDSKQERANAHLIAAAPDLYAFVYDIAVGDNGVLSSAAYELLAKARGEK